MPEDPNVTSIYLAAADRTPLPAARAGQYLTLRLGAAGTPVPVRSYSLSSGPGAASYRISVKREPHGAASTWLNQSLRAGMTLEVAAPRGDFVLDSGDGPVLLLSAGIGVTPVLAMLHELADRNSEREIWWVHAARSPHEHPLAAEARGLLAGLPHAHEQVFYRAAGRLSTEKLARLGLPADLTAYVCGPESFMTDMQRALADVGVDPARIHTEFFTTLAPINPGLIGVSRKPPHPPAGPPGAGPAVTFARSGITVPFDARWRNLLDLADACDVPTRWSCRTGVCHTCVTPVLAGDVTYAPDPLEPPPGRAGAGLLRPPHHRPGPGSVRRAAVPSRHG